MALLVTKSELAQELGVSRGRVSQLIARGLPVQPDGKINLELACHWTLGRVTPECELNTENSRCRWNARQVLDLLESARARGEPDEEFGTDPELRGR
jgi:hypothetical protein